MDIELGLKADRSSLFSEMGHNMGAAHDRANAGSSGGMFNFSYGYQEPNNLFRTIMGG